MFSQLRTNCPEPFVALPLNLTFPEPFGSNLISPLDDVDSVPDESVAVPSVNDPPVTVPLAVISVKSPVEAVVAPIVVPLIAPPVILAFEKSTVPDPSGSIAIFPLAPSVIVIAPVVALPVFKTKS